MEVIQSNNLKNKPVMLINKEGIEVILLVPMDRYVGNIALVIYGASHNMGERLNLDGINKITIEGKNGKKWLLQTMDKNI